MESETMKLLEGMRVDENLVMIDIEASTDKEALDILGKKLLEQGVVKESYLPAVQAREVEYCTGLQFEEMGIAIPHTDTEHVNEGAIGIGILKKPVTFQSMGMPDVPVEVEIMFMMAMKEAHTQIEFLQALMTIFQTEGRLKALKNCKTSKEVSDTFQSFFQ